MHDRVSPARKSSVLPKRAGSVTGHHKHQPAVRKMLISNLLDMGESISDACFKLATELTIEAADNLLFQLNGASTGIRQFRKALVAEGIPPDVVV